LKVDLVAKTCTFYNTPSYYQDGCNTSVSPNGLYFMHDLPIDPRGKSSPYYWGDESTNTLIRNWTTGDSVWRMKDPCCADVQRFSHFTDSVIMFHNYYYNVYRPDGCASQYQTEEGIIMNWYTKETLILGNCLAYDFFPGSGGAPVDSAVKDPMFAPASGVLPAGVDTIAITTATAGASIRYTTDGTDPSTTAGTLISSGGKITITLAAGAGVTVKAIAYKTGMKSSIIASAVYSALDATNAIVVTSPAAGQTYRIGDTVRVRWTNLPAYDNPGMKIEASADDGMNWHLLLNQAVATTDTRWRNFPWIIPAQMDGQSMISSQARIRVYPYTSGAIVVQGTSGAFSISQAMAVGRAPRGRAAALGDCLFYTIDGKHIADPARTQQSLVITVSGAPGRMLARVLVAR
jgi:hypothetical protein